MCVCLSCFRDDYDWDKYGQQNNAKQCLGEIVFKCGNVVEPFYIGI